MMSPHPGRKNLERRKSKMNGAGDKTIEQVDKQVANAICVWCGNKQPNDRYNVICELCHCCQFCGLVAVARSYCHLCGNRAINSDIAKTPKRIKVRKANS